MTRVWVVDRPDPEEGVQVELGQRLSVEFSYVKGSLGHGTAGATYIRRVISVPAGATLLGLEIVRETAMEATFESRCPECDEQIKEGDEIVKNEDGEWVHERCAE